MTVSAAALDADAAARAARVQVLPLDSVAAVQDAAELFARVWHTPPSAPPFSAQVMRAVEHVGGYVVGAYADGRLVGASAGFLGRHGGVAVLHSHISGVDEPGRGTGLALKLHQRAWALARDITVVTWTFDPLVRRNAWFNLVKLGAVGVEYLVDLYGPMSDGLNTGESSDRLFTRWDLTATPTGPAAPAAAVLVLDEREGGPFVPSRGTDGSEGGLLVRLPADVVALRETEPQTAGAWREAVRAALMPAFADGHTVRGMTRDGCLLLRR